MRTLTQVWVFFVSLTIALLIIGFEWKGRVGLFISFIFSLFMMYIIFHRGFLLFRKQQSYREKKGSDPTGFLSVLNSLKSDYGIQSLHFYVTSEITPPLIWKDQPNFGYILLNDQLLHQLTSSEKVLLAHFLLSHLKIRPTFRPRLFSVFQLSFLKLQFLFSPLMSLFATLLQSQKYYMQSDLLGLHKSHVSNYEFGYFLKKLHDFKFHLAPGLEGAEYFSALTVPYRSGWKNFGQPSLNKRFISIMGFAP